MVEAVSADRLELARKAWRLRSRLDAGEESLREELAELESRLDGRAFRVPTEQLDQLEKQLNKTIRQAERMGVVPPIFQVLEHQMVDLPVSSSGVVSARQVSLLVLVGGDVSPAEGWRYVACLEHVAGAAQSTVMRLPGTTELDLSAFKDAPPRCEHCNLNRQRKTSFLVEGPDGSIRQVGSACLHDYIGGSTADQAARYAESLLDLAALLAKADQSALSGWGGSDPKATGFFDPQQYLGWVARGVRESGWVSRSEAFSGGGASSADTARSSLLAALSGASLPQPSDEDNQMAADVISWARQKFSSNRSGLSDFERRAAEALDQPLVSYRSLPVLAALLPTYQRELERKQRFSASSHLGSPGERLSAQVTVRSVSERETDYGLQRIYQMEDSQGNLLTWFSSSSQDLDVGEQYSLKGTVKRHDQLGGVPRTILTRCRLED